ncbi:uncharacterized protein LTR77_007246 [Saxophila tyrrhenica]|uniref:Lipid droplet-associated hydrolase n=1 Tax=Saxophila tyrrhenica TaxID=1690608 RepID=A0AAV9P4M3_9PEZI|nr:hypothetical protein LTR77_007246 [Saxophila tyrrhenica]
MCDSIERVLPRTTYDLAGAASGKEGRLLIRQNVLVYFIPGNPGLIEYYSAFADYLTRALEKENKDTLYHFMGTSLPGFHVNPQPDDEVDKLPLSLEEQVGLAANFIAVAARHDQELFRRQCETSGLPRPGPLPVILVGHSVGTYITLQTIARRQAQQKNESAAEEADFEIVGGICLFPTIIDLAKSPTGKQVNWLATSPYLAPTLQTLTKLLTTISPTFALRKLVQLITGQNAGAAETTAAFLSSKHGVLQALYMARHELLEMTHDKWSDDLWNGPLPVGKDDEVKMDRPKLYFYWGANDHWIDNSTRDSVIASRARRDSDAGGERKPVMEVDQLGTPHDFCIKDETSKIVAEKAAGYVIEILRELEARR